MSTGSTNDFDSFGVSQSLLEAIKRLGYSHPTEIQKLCIPVALEDKDIIAVAPTGSGKTAAFAIPILQKLWDKPQGLFACILSPTRELAYQISAQFEALGAAMGVRCVVIVGGDVDKVSQAVALAKKPHIVVATPGRLLDHLTSTKGFNLRSVRYLVLDEADRLLDLDFGKDIDSILGMLPRERRTFLFSATMTTKVAKLQRANLRDPARLEAALANKPVDTLLQYYSLCPLVQKDPTLVSIVHAQQQNSAIIFVRTIHTARRLAIVLRLLGFSVVPLHGDLTQSQRLGALAKFKTGRDRKILVATDLASRGLDIPHVDLVINFDMPTSSNDYIHRVGRTARAGRAGIAISIVTQYDVELLQRLETVVGSKFPEWPVDPETVSTLRETVEEAARQAVNELKNDPKFNQKASKRKHVDDAEYEGIEEVQKLNTAGAKRTGKAKRYR